MASIIKILYFFTWVFKIQKGDPGMQGSRQGEAQFLAGMMIADQSEEFPSHFRCGGWL